MTAPALPEEHRIPQDQPDPRPHALLVDDPDEGGDDEDWTVLGGSIGDCLETHA